MSVLRVLFRHIMVQALRSADRPPSRPKLPTKCLNVSWFQNYLNY
jgi:hypothetical protein